MPKKTNDAMNKFIRKSTGHFSDDQPEGQPGGQVEGEDQKQKPPVSNVGAGRGSGLPGPFSMSDWIRGARNRRGMNNTIVMTVSKGVSDGDND